MRTVVSRVRRRTALAGFGLGVCLLAATSATAQSEVRLYRGTLAIGFGDADNQPPAGDDDFNNGLPRCAQTNPFAPATFATHPVIGFLRQGTGPPPRSLQFDAWSPIDPIGQVGGGLPPIRRSTCIVQFPAFFGPSQSVRSLVYQDELVWPGRPLNAARTNFETSGPGGGTLQRNGGVTTAIDSTVPDFYRTDATGRIQITPGPNGFGGYVPANAVTATQIGVNFLVTVTTPPSFGVLSYGEAFLERRAVFGTRARDGRQPFGVRVTRPFTWRLRTPGPTGFSTTLPLTPNRGFTHGAQIVLTQTPGSPLLTTMGENRGLYHRWTTGRVRHTDGSGRFVTDRSATGYDWTSGQFTANGVTTVPYGTTRKIQLVTPWSASVQRRLDQPWSALLDFLPDFGFGGVAILSLDIAPVPEPVAGLGALIVWLGTMVFLFVRETRRRRTASTERSLSASRSPRPRKSRGSP